MRKNIFFLLLTACMLSAVATSSYAEGEAETYNIQNSEMSDSAMNEHLLGNVVVTGWVGSTMLRQSAVPVSVMRSDEIAMQAATNIIDALSHQPGVAQVTTGSGISKPVIRGLGYNRIVVVNDGVRQEGQQWGDEHGIEIDPQTVHSVEIVKGPATLMYGSDAMAGVLIFHDEPVQTDGTVAANASTEYQTNNRLFAYTADVAGNNGGFVWNARYSGKSAGDYENRYDGRVFNSGFKEQAVSALLGVNRNWGFSHLKLSTYYLRPDIIEGERDEETGDFVRDEAPYQKIFHYKAVLDNSIRLGNGSLKVLAAYQQNVRKEYEDDECGLHFRLHTLNYDVHYTLPEVGSWKMMAGVGGMYQSSENLGTEFLVPAYRLFDYGLFATAQRQWGKWTWSGGLRYDHRHLRSDLLEEEGAVRFAPFSRGFSGMTGSIGGVCNINGHWDFRINLSRGFRAPNISELASNGVHEGTERYETGSQALDPETSWQSDFGLDYFSDRLKVQMSVFANRISGYIFSEKTPEGTVMDDHDVYRFVSGNAFLWGGELTADWHIVESLHFENTFSYVSARQLNQPEDSRYLPLTPAPRLTSNIRYDWQRISRSIRDAFVQIGVEGTFRQGDFYAANNTETATPGYALFNASVGFSLHNSRRNVATLYIVGNNLFDKAYQSHLSRLKYTALNAATGRTGVYNMGRNVCLKLILHVL